MTRARTAPHVEAKTAQSCPLCRDPLTSLPQLLACPDCQLIHHQACVAEMGRCGTMGCGGLHDLARESGAGPAGLPANAETSRVLGAGAYLGNLVGAALVLPLLIYVHARLRDDAFARHHARQATLLVLAAIFSFGLLLPVMLVCSVYAGFKAYQGEWWVLPGLRGERRSPRLLRRLSDPEAQAKWALQRKAGQTATLPPLLRPLARLLEPREPPRP